MLDRASAEGQTQILQALARAGQQADHEAIIAGGQLWGIYKTTTEKIDTIIDSLHVSDVPLPTQEEQTNSTYQAAEEHLRAQLLQGNPLAITVAFGKLYEGYLLGVALTAIRLEEATQGSRAREEVPELVRTLDALAQVYTTVENTLSHEREQIAPLLETIAPFAPAPELPASTQTSTPSDNIWLKVHQGFLALSDKMPEETPPLPQSLEKSQEIQPAQLAPPILASTRPKMSPKDMAQASLGALARRYRLDANLTQEELAKKLRRGEGVSVSHISAFERGGHMSPQLFEELMNVLQVSESDRAIMWQKLGNR